MRVDPVLGVGLYQIRSGEMLGRSFRLADLLRVLPPIRLRDLFVLGHDLGLVWRSGLSTADGRGYSIGPSNGPLPMGQNLGSAPKVEVLSGDGPGFLGQVIGLGRLIASAENSSNGVKVL